MALSRAVFGTQLVALCISAAISRAQQPTQAGAPDSTRRDSTPAILIGRVVDSGGFRITGLPPGTIVFNVRRIGFESASFTAVLKPGKTHRAAFPMTANAQ